jgi:hypothetical protein
MKANKKDLHARILRIALKTLVGELLPKAVKEFKSKPTGRTTYPVTNIVSEIRGVISQIESIINAEEISETLSYLIAVSVKRAISNILNNIEVAKKSSLIEIKDTSLKREVGVLLDTLKKEQEKTLIEMIEDINIKINSSITSVITNKKK